MARAVLALLLAAAGVALASACTQTYLTRGRHLAEGAAQPWNYDQSGADWSGTCASGQTQSPIAIQLANLTTTVPPSGRASLQLGLATGLSVINTGKFIQVEWESLSGSAATVPVVGDSWGAMFQDPSLLASATVRQVPVKPLQFHWHSTCEHVVEVDNTTGAWVPQRCRQELCLAVFGVTLMMPANPYAPGSPFYQQVVDAFPAQPGTQGATQLPGVELDLSSLLPDNTTYATYAGSLTTPPCSEGVQWHVFLNPKTDLSAAQLDAFQAASATVQGESLASCPADEVVPGSNPQDSVQLACRVPTGARTTNRQIMPLNGRTVLVSRAAAGTASD
uniref:carbonic anhydrase n=1 Tax=Chlorella sp. ArM0029B TaxID=1415603 RepID=A0A345AZY1_9CHLO|nr:carbonic anhydrase CAH1850 [Chlorella sp. ArM0029B]